MFNKKIVFFCFFSVFIVTFCIYFLLKNSSSTSSVNTLQNQVSINESLVTLNVEQTYVSPTTEADTKIEEINPPSEDIDLIDKIQSQLNNMSLDEKIGQLFIFGFKGEEYDESSQLHKWIHQYHIGNFIVFKRNITSLEQLSTLITSIDSQRSQAQETPIWIGIDQEGGVVNRLPTKYDSAQQFAKWNDTAITYMKHDEMAQQLQHLGIDINFGPVLDINSNPHNPVINTRAFGTDAETVIKHTDVVIDAYEHNRIVAVGKHFPGHGDTNDDSHFKLPIISKTWDQLLQLELMPFQHAISKNITSIMVGHLLISDVDDVRPASLSKALIQHKLIEELQFNGLIITDDLIMEGVLAHHTIGEATVMALQAGVHMVIIGHDEKKQLQTLEAVKMAIEQEELTIDQLDDKVYRILKLKHDYTTQ